MQDFKVIVPGGLNTDLFGSGVERLLEPGELAFGGKLIIGPGGKARNMAQMAAVYLGPGKVAMIGRTSRDPYGLWKAPIQALMKAAVDTTYVRELSFEEAGGKFPGIALIPVDKVGQNQIYVLPGVNEDFSVADIDAADQLFHNTSGDKIVLLALEIPMETALYAADKARLENIRVILDPGGISGPIAEKILRGLFLIKPNEHETKLLTGIAVEGFESAKIAASNLLAKGVQHVLITHGSRGAYLFGEKLAEHIPVPDILPTGETDETGCGDQVTAILAGCLAEGKEMEFAARVAIKAGTLQFHRTGIQPVTIEELLE